jgi:hypothetical protein
MIMILNRNQFNQEIKSFHQKYSDNWILLTHESAFNKDSCLYLKMTDSYNQFTIDSFIVFSDSYHVPVLYFLPMLHTEESTRLARIDELKDLLSSDPGSIALAENPINGLVMFHVHPCLTSKFMEEVLNPVSSDNSPIPLIESWLSFCPLIPTRNSLKG